MSNIYSTRFLFGRAGTHVDSYTVPAGHRAVVKNVTVYHWAAGEVTYIQLNQIPFYGLIAPAANTGVSVDVMLPIYEDELLQVSTNGTDISWAVSGYLFNEA